MLPTYPLGKWKVNHIPTGAAQFHLVAIVVPPLNALDQIDAKKPIRMPLEKSIATAVSEEKLDED